MRRLGGSRLLFALPGALALATVAATYHLAHPYPALGGGLFLQMAETVAANGYALPERVPGYTVGGLPYAYPPLGAYVLAALLDAGAPPIATARWLPTAFLFAAVPAYYLFAEATLALRSDGDATRKVRLQAAVATVVVVTTPAVLEYTITAGGTVRAAALAVTAAGAAVGVRLFGRREYRLALPAAALFGIALLLHLKYALYLATSYLFLYVALDRTPRGLLRGAAVAVGGFVVAAPWWVQVGATHGFDVFFRAGATHGGLGSWLWPVNVLGPEAVPPSVWPALIVIAGLFSLVRGEYLLPTWTAVVGFVVGNDEHVALIGALMVPILLSEAVRFWRGADGDRSMPTWRDAAPAVAAIVLIAGYGVGAGAAYASDTERLPAYVDGDDVAAAEWVRSETPPDATFVVAGDAAEWFPLLADRTSVIAARGSEWDGPASYDRQRRLRAELAECPSAACITRTLADAGVSPNYLYLPRDGYATPLHRGLAPLRWSLLRGDFAASPRYEIVFRNRGVVIVRVADRDPPEPNRTPDADRDHSR